MILIQTRKWSSAAEVRRYADLAGLASSSGIELRISSTSSFCPRRTPEAKFVEDKTFPQRIVVW
jgi:hypothetical protein